MKAIVISSTEDRVDVRVQTGKEGSINLYRVRMPHGFVVGDKLEVVKWFGKDPFVFVQRLST